MDFIFNITDKVHIINYNDSVNPQIRILEIFTFKISVQMVRYCVPGTTPHIHPMYNPHAQEDEKEKIFPGISSGNEYNFNYNAANNTAVTEGYSLYGQQQQQPVQGQQQYSTGFPSSTNNPTTAPFSNSNTFDNIDISRNGNRFSSGTPFETVHEFVSVSNKVKNREREREREIIYDISYTIYYTTRNFKTFWILLLHILDHVG